MPNWYVVEDQVCCYIAALLRTLRALGYDPPRWDPARMARRAVRVVRRRLRHPTNLSYVDLYLVALETAKDLMCRGQGGSVDMLRYAFKYEALQGLAAEGDSTVRKLRDEWGGAIQGLAYALLPGFARKAGDHKRIEAEVWSNAWMQAQKCNYDPDRPLRKYLNGITRNLAIAASKPPPVKPLQPSMPGGGPSPPILAGLRQHYQQLLAALAALASVEPKHFRAILLWFAPLTLAEAARALHEPPGTVMGWVTAARAWLKDRLSFGHHDAIRTFAALHKFGLENYIGAGLASPGGSRAVPTGPPGVGFGRRKDILDALVDLATDSDRFQAVMLCFCRLTDAEASVLVGSAYASWRQQGLDVLQASLSAMGWGPREALGSLEYIARYGLEAFFR